MYTERRNLQFWNKNVPFVVIIVYIYRRSLILTSGRLQLPGRFALLLLPVSFPEIDQNKKTFTDRFFSIAWEQGPVPQQRLVHLISGVRFMRLNFNGIKYVS
jgi:hypothetical protein